MCLENSTNNIEESSHPNSRNEERHSSSQSLDAPKDENSRDNKFDHTCPNESMTISVT